MKHISRIALLASLLSPLRLFAQPVSNIEDFQGMLIGWLTQLGYLFWIGSIVAFFYGLVKFVKNAEDSEEHEKGKSLMVWGIIAFLVLVSLWGIVQIILVNTLGINASDLEFHDRNGIPV